MYNLISDFPKHIENALSLQWKGKLNSGTFNEVLILGMGGSGIGGDLLQALAEKTAQVPVLVNKTYSIPSFVKSSTLVVASSYSGNTEETLAAVAKAKEKGAKICCITSGGKLAQLAEENQWPALIVPGGNPPRTMLAYSLVCLIRMLSGHGILSYALKEQLGVAAKKLTEIQGPIKKLAHGLADSLLNKVIVLYSSPSYSAVTLRLKQQLNENTKILSYTNQFPELNHNELVGWRLAPSNMAVLLFKDEKDYVRTQKRMEISEGIIKEKAAYCREVVLKGDNLLEKMLYGIHFGDWLSFYLAEKANVDTIDIREIDLLKNELSSFDQF